MHSNPSSVMLSEAFEGFSKSDDTQIKQASNNLPYLVHNALENLQYSDTNLRIKHGFFTKLGGVSQDVYTSLNGGLGSQDTVENVHENRRLAAQAFGYTPAHIIALYQTHSADCMTVHAALADPINDRPYADALVTDKSDIMLLLLTADCVPVIFADTASPIIGIAHAGWRGAAGGILENTAASLVNLGAKAQNLIAVIGPSIHQKSYQIGAEIAEIIAKHHDNASSCLKPDKGAEDERYLFDLPEFVSQILTKSGISQVHNVQCDTYADPDRFFSHRWATHHNLADSGRLISAISIGASKEEK